MKEIGKNLRFFGIINGKMLLMMYGMCFGFSVLFTLMDEGAFVENMVSNLSSYLLMMGPIVIIIQSVTGYMHYFSMVISMGATRKNALAGMLIAFYLMTLLIVAFAMGIWAVLPLKTDYLQYKYLIIGLVLFMTFTGNLMGAALIKFGPKAGFVIYLVIYFLTLGITFFAIGWIKSSGNTQGLSYMNTPWIVPAGLVLSGISVILPYFATRKFEVRA